MKIGALNFSDCMNNAEQGKEFYSLILTAFDQENVKYELVNCLEKEADIVFIAPFHWHNVEEIKGNPVKIYYTGESDKRIDFTNQDRKYCDFSCSFFKDSDTNLFYPLWQRTKIEIPKKDITDKTDFCSFIIGKYEPHYDGSNKRVQVFNYLSDHYKRVYSYGKCMNNMGMNLPFDLQECVKIHKNIKFNLCFENNSSVENESYITEKIINAFNYGTVPIYWGGNDDMYQYFNKDSFINCNGKNQEEILDIVKYYDEHMDQYKKMLYTDPLLDMSIDYVRYSNKRLITFLKNNNII